MKVKGLRPRRNYKLLITFSTPQLPSWKISRALQYLATSVGVEITVDFTVTALEETETFSPGESVKSP